MTGLFPAGLLPDLGPVVRQYLCVHRSRVFGAYQGGLDKDWYRDVPMKFLPAVGDEIVLWPDEDGGVLGGVSWPVRRRRWGSDGTPCLDLIAMRVDPDETACRAMMLVPGCERAWRTEADGWDLDVHLPRGGWRT